VRLGPAQYFKRVSAPQEHQTAIIAPPRVGKSRFLGGVDVVPPRGVRLNPLYGDLHHCYDVTYEYACAAGPDRRPRIVVRTVDRVARTEPGRKGFLARFEREVDPDGVLPEAERARRAEHARRAYMQKLALASAATRRSARANEAR
jgi:hypothetical protein